MKSIHSQLHNWNLDKKRVIVRADLSVSLHNGIIQDDFRLIALQPTLDLILKQNASITLITHLGRPTTNHDLTLSTQQLIPWFIAHGYSIIFAPTIADAYNAVIEPGTIVLLENIRFFPAEQHPENSFAQTLAQLGSYYVNDAFGVLHHADTSITLLAQAFAPDHRTIGLVVEHELRMLHDFLQIPPHSLCLILGGAKAHEKIPLIPALLDKIKTLLLCPALVFNFEKARGSQIGRSLISDDTLELCKTIMSQATEKNISVLFPIDYQIASQTINGPLHIINTNIIPDSSIGIAIGPKTAALFSQTIEKASTIFFNGAMGFIERPETLETLNILFSAIEKFPGTSMIAGGDSIAAAHFLHRINAFDYVSTGGGATLAYISGKQLPGLIALGIKP